jgi:DNA topoisomerase I
MSGKIFVIVESPTKAKTIRKFLPSNYIVDASIGHVRDLPKSAADIPKKLKGEEWTKLGIDVENNFKPLYVTPKGKGKIVRELKKKLKEADLLLLATDEDREGESISWHLVDILKPKIPVRRMVFHEITKKAIERALENGRDIDIDLVNAQETRRILDRLYGYTLSPLIWKKISYGLSAGRVQSPGLRLIVDRERERIKFKKAVYWDLSAAIIPGKGSEKELFEAKLETVDKKRISTGKDFDPATGKVSGNKDVLILDKESAKSLEDTLKNESWKVSSIGERSFRQKPAPPFITSTLQQDGNRKLRMSARETMRTAQHLYEQGFITYMRTDSPTLSTEGISGAIESVNRLYGNSFLTESPRQFSSISKGAQEAHEAIRPAGEVFVHPDESGLSGRELALYTLIWKRTLASQMKDAEKISTTAKIEVGNAVFSSTGTRIAFPGFLRVYVEGRDEPDAALDDKETFLPELKEGQEVLLNKLTSVYHETKAPSRFTEAGLVSQLEKMGIGRPSTYASIINTLFDRQYIRRQGTALVPTFTGFAVIQLLENHFNYLIEYSFTSEMETALDEISLGKIDRIKYLENFYLGKNGLKGQVENREKEIKPEEARTIMLPHLGPIPGVKVGKYGPYFIQEQEGDKDSIHASIPEEIAPADLSESDILEIIELQKNGPVPIGKDPETGENIYCLTGRYGAYFQLGEKTEDIPKPKRASLPKGTKPKDVTLEDALRQLSLPKLVGKHPETGLEIRVNEGRFGPYIAHNEEFRSLKKDDDLFSVTLERCIELLAEPKKGRGGSVVLKDFTGDKKTSLTIIDGRYGPYIKYGKNNIKLPDEKKDRKVIEALTVEEVMAIVKDA